MAMIPTVSLVVNLCVTDLPFVDRTVRHMVRSLDYPFVERRMVLDLSLPRGRFSDLQRGSGQQLVEVAEQLQRDGFVDVINHVDWQAQKQKAVLSKYFGDHDTTERCTSGTAVYQYLYGLEQCQGEYVLHADSDMLFHGDPRSCWIREGIQLMRRDPEVVTVIVGHPLVAQNRIERLLDRPFRWPSRWIRDQSFSTRCFLWNQAHIEERVLPLIPAKDGERLEESFANTFRIKGFYRCTREGTRCWAVHPLPHGDGYLDHLDQLIWGTEHGVYPFRRDQKRPWNLYTDDARLNLWLDKIRQYKDHSLLKQTES